MKGCFDFEKMARLVAGPFYARFKLAQRAVFRTRLEKKAFSRQITAHSARQPRVQFLRGGKSRGGRELTIQMRLLFSDDAVRRLAFRLNREEEAGWKIFDVAAGGRSAVLYYRKYFLAMARKHGPQA